MIGEKTKRRLYLGSDHAGFEAKEELQSYLKEKGDFAVVDLGCFSEDPCDYPDIAREVSEKVVEVPDSLGMIFCGTGIGMAMAANRYKGIRAANVYNEHLAEMTRKHNDANILALGARELDVDLMKKIADKFLETPFEKGEERHVRRVKKIDGIG